MVTVDDVAFTSEREPLWLLSSLCLEEVEIGYKCGILFDILVTECCQSASRKRIQVFLVFFQTVPYSSHDFLLFILSVSA